jgi:hypothetical protein
MPTRWKSLAAAAAAIALTTTANAQTYSFSQAQLGRISPISFVTTTQQSLAAVDAAQPAAVTSSDVSANKDLLSRVMLGDHPVTVDRSASTTDEEESGSEGSGFFNSATGRASIFGLAGLAGASYFALRPATAAAVDVPVSFSMSKEGALIPVTTNLPSAIEVAVVTTPEPGTWALMASGLGVLGLIARRRRSN